MGYWCAMCDTRDMHVKSKFWLDFFSISHQSDGLYARDIFSELSETALLGIFHEGCHHP